MHARDERAEVGHRDSLPVDKYGFQHDKPLTEIADRLGTSKAALYYHFRSKAAILDALLAEPLAAYTRLADSAAGGEFEPADLLAAVIDTTVAARSLLDLLAGDPSARAELDAAATRARSAEINDTIVAALAGPGPSPAAAVRARAAYTVAKQCTLDLLSERDSALDGEVAGVLDDTTRAEVLAALRALGG